MKIAILTNDNFFSYTVLERFLEQRTNDIQIIVFSSSLIGKKNTFDSIKWALQSTGIRHTIFKLLVYGIFKLMKLLCTIFPFIKNHYSSLLWAMRNEIEILTTSNVNSQDVIDKLNAMKLDLIISASMNQIVNKEILKMPTKKCINVHCAPLPRYGGMSPYIWALANNEDQSAATIHYMEEGLDIGDIILQDDIPILNKDSAFALFYRCCKRASELLITVVNDIEADTVRSHPQDLSKKTYFSWPTRQCINDLHSNGFTLATVKDFWYAIFKQQPRNKLTGQ
jgi:methionyl-tRNA formyltransferase